MTADRIKVHNTPHVWKKHKINLPSKITKKP